MEVEAPENDGKLSKKDKKKQKKLKAEDGKAIPTGEAGSTPSKKPESNAEGTPAKTADSKTEKKEKGDKKKESASPTKGKPKELESGLKILDNKVGTGKAAKNGDMVSMRYIGKLENGTVFDSNTKGKPVSVFSNILFLIWIQLTWYSSSNSVLELVKSSKVNSEVQPTFLVTHALRRLG